MQAFVDRRAYVNKCHGWLCAQSPLSSVNGNNRLPTLSFLERKRHFGMILNHQTDHIHKILFISRSLDHEQSLPFGEVRRASRKRKRMQQK